MSGEVTVRNIVQSAHCGLDSLVASTGSLDLRHVCRQLFSAVSVDECLDRHISTLVLLHGMQFV